MTIDMFDDSPVARPAPLDRKAYMAQYRERNRDEIRSKSREYRQATRNTVLDYYGGVCELCGTNDREVLTVDHIWDDGAAHRKQVQASAIFTWLIKNQFPPGFRILCFNCNHKAHQVCKSTGNPPLALRTLQREISKWADNNFPGRDHVSVKNKLDKEIAEWAKDPENADEFADVMILILDWAHLMGVDMQAAVNTKMKINLTRNWIFNPADRTWQHKDR